MSGKFKKDVARSQTLSQISCFSGQFGTNDSVDGDFDKEFGSIYDSIDNNPANRIMRIDSHFDSSKKTNSIR